MGRTTFEDIWDEYQELEPDERPQFLYDSSITLREQGSETAHRAVLYQAIDDAFEVGDFRTAANAAAELSQYLNGVDENQEAAKVLEESIQRFPPWQGFELGISYRALAWVCKALGDPLRHEECLNMSIAHFDSSAFPEWAFPLRNELGEILLAREDWSSLADLLLSALEESGREVAPIAHSIRNYLVGRLALHQLNLEVAIKQLLLSAVGLEEANHRLLNEALDSLAWAIQRSEQDWAEVTELHEPGFEMLPGVRLKLGERLRGQARLFL